MGKFSRDKGSRGERAVAKLVGGKRTGYAGVSNPDVTSPFAVYSVKDTKSPISLSVALSELELLGEQAPGTHYFVAVKVNHKWLVIESMEQHQGDHV